MRHASQDHGLYLPLEVVRAPLQPGHRGLRARFRRVFRHVVHVCCHGGDRGEHRLGRPEDRRSRHAHSAPSPGRRVQTGNYIICHTFGDESWANEPDSMLSCGRAYSTGSSHSEGIRWYSDGLLVKRFVRVTDAGTWSLSPTGEGPTVRFVSHLNFVDYLAT